MSEDRALNLLALPKDLNFMRCFIAPQGHLLMNFDCAALEPHVLAFLSKDSTLYKIYGPGAWPHHDIYFIAGMKVPGLGDEIRKHYDINNPSKEGVAKLKEIMGDVRKKKLKPAYLGWIYGIGAEKLSINLDITVHEAKTILNSIGAQFVGRNQLAGRLLAQWKKNGGYVLNARGLPMCVENDKKKDLVNRVIQSSGHQIFQRINYHIQAYRDKHKVAMRAYIPDWHDEGVWVVKRGSEKDAAAAVNYGFKQINEELGWDIKMKHGGISFGQDLRIRCEDFEPELKMG